MSIQFQCPMCGSQLEVSETHAGTVKRCPQCSELVRIPHGAVPATAEVKPAVADRETRNAKEAKPAPASPPAVTKPLEPKPEAPRVEIDSPKPAANPQLAAIELVTTDEFVKPGQRVARTFPMLRAHRVAGAKFFRDLFIAVRDTTGGRSPIAEKLFDEIETEVLSELQMKALELGANAVIGVQIQRIDVSGKSEMFYVTAHGTPIALERVPES